MSHAACQQIDREPATARTPDLATVKLVAAILVTIVSWAGAFVAIGVAAKELSPAPFALARLGSAALVLLLFLPFMARDVLKLPRLRDLPGIALMALLAFPVYHVALNAGQQVVTPGVSALLINTLPVFAAIIARFGLQERLSPIGWAGIAIAFSGVAMLVLTNGGSFSINGHAVMILGSAISGATFMVIQRYFTRRYSGFALTFWGMWLGAVMLLPFAGELQLQMANASSKTWYAVAYLGTLPTAIAYVTWAHVLKHLPAARATSMLYFVPPMTFTFAWLILDEVPTLTSIIGGLVILSGVALVQRTRMKV